jgi:drug/metabolite transporter (DMT)-like permease
LAGIGFLTLTTLLVATQDVLSKELTVSLPVSQILAIRFAAMAVFVIWYYGRREPVRNHLRSGSTPRQIVRCVVACVEIALFTFALRYLGLAEIHALFACFPLIVTALSPMLLSETVGWRRWTAVSVGFAGTLIVLQPGSGVFDVAALLGLGCALLYALYNIMTRQVSSNDSVATSMVYLALTGLVGSVLVAAFQWQPVSGREWLYLAAICVATIGSNIFLIKALALCPAVILQPFNYLILVWAVAFAYLLYGERLTLVQLAGVLLVVGSGLYVGWREYRLTKA